ncbi:DUF1772 domain-containing protein [Luteimonas suaedae]|uniref:DUF1772 domain-containing protein n=1 Tax=Luteimonas suaedae TaxID=2605430 RepID=UPI001CA97D44|nr:DUF1772 domain-containing protein [Luteimonas suaedae]
MLADLVRTGGGQQGLDAPMPAGRRHRVRLDQNRPLVVARPGSSGRSGANHGRLVGRTTHRSRMVDATVTVRALACVDRGDRSDCMWMAGVQLLCLVLVACAMAFALAHAAELPGKLRLDKTAYLATQPIYHPGFTIGGASEPLAILALAVLTWMVRTDGADRLLVIASLVLVLGMQIVYWLAVHPINKFWLADRSLPPVSAGFFGLGKAPRDSGVDRSWRAFRDRWEYAHLARASLAFAAFVLLCLHVVRP